MHHQSLLPLLLVLGTLTSGALSLVVNVPPSPTSSYADRYRIHVEDQRQNLDLSCRLMSPPSGSYSYNKAAQFDGYNQKYSTIYGPDSDSLVKMQIYERGNYFIRLYNL